MRGPLAMLVLGLALVTGCHTVPTAIVKGVATLDSNTHTLGEDFKAVLGGAPLTSETAARDRALIDATESLSTHVSEWHQNHSE